ncbi:MAG: hypothetical protein ABL983_10415, partial [Nitrospira sp.]
SGEGWGGEVRKELGGHATGNSECPRFFPLTRWETQNVPVFFSHVVFYNAVRPHRTLDGGASDCLLGEPICTVRGYVDVRGRYH